MSPYLHSFTNFEYIEPLPISAADNRTFDAIGKEDMQISIPNGASASNVTLRDVLYAPSIGYTLVSLSRVDAAGYSTLIRDGTLHILDRRGGDSTIGQIPVHGGVWRVDKGAQSVTSVAPAAALTSMMIMDLHRRLGHISPAAAVRLVEDGRVTGIELTESDNASSEFCIICAQAKTKRRPFPKE
jgi:hypothetical protein